jgi:excisionase family DNA binding protein
MSTNLIKSSSRFLTTQEAAEFLGVSAGTLAVWRCVSRYPLPFVRIGRNVRYQEADLVSWVESRKVHQAVDSTR